jgi:hypothetical protein
MGGIGMARRKNILRKLISRKPSTGQDIESARLAEVLSRVAHHQADLKRAKIGLHSIPRDEHTRIRLRARSKLRSLPQPKLACGSDEAEDS